MLRAKTHFWPLARAAAFSQGKGTDRCMYTFTYNTLGSLLRCTCIILCDEYSIVKYASKFGTLREAVVPLKLVLIGLVLLCCATCG